jgi:O-antigen ligase
MNQLVEKYRLDPAARWLVVSGLALAVTAGLITAGLIMVDPVIPLLLLAFVAVAAIATNPWRGLILLLIAAQLNIFRYDLGPFTFRPEQVILVIVALVWLTYFLSGKARISATVLDIPIIGLIVTAFVSSYLFSPDPSYSYQGLFLQIVYMSMYFYTVYVLLEHRSRLDLTVKLMMLMAAIHALYSLTAFISHFLGINIGGISFSHLITLKLPSTSGLFQEANLLGAYVAIMLILFTTHLVTYGKEKIASERFLWLGLILLFIATMTSLTRAAWVGVIIVMVYLPFYSRPVRNVINPRSIAFILAMLMIFAVSFPLVNYVFSESSGTNNAFLGRVQNLLNFQSSSAAGRTDVQTQGIEEWRSHPFLGNGLLSIGEKNFSNRGWLFSSMIQSLHDTGLVGAFLMLWIHVVPIVYAFRAAGKARSSIRKANLYGMALGAIVMIVASQASSFFWLGFPWIYLGILVALSKATLSEADEEQNGSRVAVNG